ncbi:hypothetical protein [Streptomyces albogriseolus]|uniref:hypothetical protein n=1 Tax=Streptomyces albogriseolus TaxID=1887 RepID=UPI0037F2D34D
MVKAVNSVLAETGRMMTKMPRQGRAGPRRGLTMDLNSAQRITQAEAARTGLETGPNRRLKLTLLIGMPMVFLVFGIMILVPKSLRDEVLHVYQAGIIGCLLHYAWVFAKYPRHAYRPPYLTRDLAMGGGLLPALLDARLLAGHDRRPGMGTLRRHHLCGGSDAGAQ